MRFLLPGILVLVPAFLLAQSISHTEADGLYNSGKWREAQSLYLIAADKLSGEQLYNLGDTYLRLNNSKEGYTAAVPWFTKGAALGNVSCMQMLADAFGTGRAGVKDTVAAFQWLKKAAAKDSRSMFAVGSFYYSGTWTSRNVKEATTWLEAAYKAGNKEALSKLATIYYEIQDDANAVKWIQMLSENNIAKFYLGNIYRRNKGVLPNEHAAFYYYYSALEKKPARDLSDKILDVVEGESMQFPDEGSFKTRLDRILNEFTDGFAAVSGPKLLTNRPGIYPRGISGGMDMDALNGTLTFCEYRGEPYFQLPYIRRYMPSSATSPDADGLVFSGIINHGSADSTNSEMLFDLYADLLQQQYTQFKFSNIVKKTVAGKKLNASVFGEGVHKGKNVFLDLRLRELGGLYYVEMVIKNRRYFRGD